MSRTDEVPVLALATLAPATLAPATLAPHTLAATLALDTLALDTLAPDMLAPVRVASAMVDVGATRLAVIVTQAGQAAQAGEVQGLLVMAVVPTAALITVPHSALPTRVSRSRCFNLLI